MGAQPLQASVPTDQTAAAPQPPDPLCPLVVLLCHQVGNIEDAEHCEGAIEKIKRGVVFAASLYL